jgi:BirA family biotin operon repressor/biotin-[acetyl-CoA-carboxylase] ligase
MTIELRPLLAALSAERVVSGSALAQRLRVTRSAVWKQIQILRDLGAPIEAAAGRGYRLERPLELLDAQRIRAELAPALRQHLGALDVHWQIDSTSSELLRRAGSGASAAPLQVCIAETQTAGRGRRGRVWQSPLGGNLYMSVLRRFDHGMGALAGLSLVVGLGVVEALGDCGICGMGLKWPNDVLVDGRKLAGILVELGGEFLGPCHAVIGIGINLHLPAVSRARIEQPVIDLASLPGGADVSRNRLAACLIARLVVALDRFAALGFAPFAPAYARHDLLRDRPIRVLVGGAPNAGVGAGVDARGALIVRHGAALQHYDSAEVSVRGALASSDA